MTTLPSPQSSPELQAGGKDGTRDVLLSTACMFSSMLTFQRLGTLGKALERKNPQNSIQASRPREETAKRWTVTCSHFAELQSDFEQL